MTSFSIIIPVWNGVQLLSTCIESLRLQHYNDGSKPEIIAVDNGSVDGSANWIAANAPEVRLFRHQNNLGFGGACNHGLRSASGDVLVLLNQDTKVYPGWLQALEEAFANPQIGIAGCKIYYPDGKTIQHAGGWLEWPLGTAGHFGYYEEDTGQWDEARPVNWVTGAAIAIRRSVFAAVGGLDEKFWPGYYEDVDYCLRASKQGFAVWYVPKAQLHHQESASIRNRSELQRVLDRNRILFVLKHLPPQHWLQETAPIEEQSLINMSEQDAIQRQLSLLELAALTPVLLAQTWLADQETIQSVVDKLRMMADIRRTKIKPIDSPRIEKWEPQPLEQLVERSESNTIAGVVEPFVRRTVELSEFEFTSKLPLLGAILSGFRRVWYNVAARWAIQHLRKEQASINWQVVAEFDHVNVRMSQLHAQDALLNVRDMQLHSQDTILQTQTDQLQSQNAQLQKQVDQLYQQLQLVIERNSLLNQQLLAMQQQMEEKRS